MKRIVILLLFVVTAFSAFCQNYLQDGDYCFDNGDYSCAITNYNEAFKLANDRDKQITEIKLTRAKFCQEHIKLANTAYTNKQYSAAKNEYQNVLESNPKDIYAKSQLEMCNNISTQKPLRKATTAELTDIWNNKYGILTERRQNLINVGIDPDDAQRRINSGEGKPVSSSNSSITLSVSKQNVSFKASAESIMIDVKTNANDYQIAHLPSWCKLKNKYSTWFSLECDINRATQSRSDWIEVTAGGKKEKIAVSQAGATKSQTTTTTLSASKESIYFNAKGGKSEQIKIYSNAQTYSIGNIPSWCKVQTNNGYVVVICDANVSKTYRQDYFTVISGDKSERIYVTQGGKNDCFNCPKTDYKWGLSAGYTEYNSDYLSEGIQIGLRYEPLFKYGFGLNTGVFYEYRSSDLFSDNYYDNYEYEEHSFNIPLHLEYRLNFSKWFNVFAYGGAGLNIITNSSFNDYYFPVTFEYGAGLRIDHVQFNIGESLYLGDFKPAFYLGDDTKTSRKLTVSVSYLF